jgi:RNA polymerase sigma factor (sigma-70 family)
MTPTLDDATALTRYAATGDPTAFEVLVHRYQAMVLSTCKRTLRNDSDAEDATQEAFLRLAQHAGAITSNAAAWLHACALRASLDLLRKKGSAARAERAAGEIGAASEDSATDPAAAADWHEIEPLLDEAIARLSESDRELVVGRFLAGRSQKDMAAEVGVNPGTMSRRIEKALDRLRDELSKSGISMSGTLAAALAIGGVKVAVSSGLTGSLVKTGLVGLTRRPPAGLLDKGLLNSTLGKVIVGSAAAVITLGAITGAVMTMSAAQSAGPNYAAAPAGITGLSVPRPAKTTGRFPLQSILSAGQPGGVMRLEGDRVIYEELRDQSWQMAPDESRAVLRITDSRRERGKEWLTLRVEASTFPDYTPFSRMLGQTLDASYTLENGRFHLAADIPGEVAELTGQDRLDWFGVRPPDWHPMAADAAVDNPLAPGVGGLWFELEPYDLVLSDRDITMKWNDYTIHRFRVLSWTEAAGQTRIQAICADSMNPSMPGDRVKILLRDDDGAGYTLVMHDQYSDKLNEWPRGFGLNAETTIMTFRKEKP